MSKEPTDVLLCSHEERVCQLLRNPGDGTLCRAEPIPIEPFAVAFKDPADFDGDGDLDLTDGYRLYRNDGSASFVGEEIASPIQRELLVGDVDGDGDPDICGRPTTCSNPSSVWRWRSTRAMGPSSLL